MLGGREALTGTAMRGTTPMPIRKAVALADDDLDDGRVLGGLCALPELTIAQGGRGREGSVRDQSAPGQAHLLHLPSHRP